MKIEIDEIDKHPPSKLSTEGPLTEKDQQGQSIESQRKLATLALEKWRHLKEKIKHPFERGKK